jgi:hypothetical protein
MVLIIPTSGCIKFDLKNIAHQMINIEQNTHLFSSNLYKSECNCIHQDIHIESDINIDLIIKDNKKFNVYEIKNPIYPEHPIIVEPFSMIGNIVIYVSNPLLGKELEYNVARYLSNNCNHIISELYKIINIQNEDADIQNEDADIQNEDADIQNEDADIQNKDADIQGYGRRFIEIGLGKNTYLSSRYTLIYENMNLELKRNIHYCPPIKNKKISSDDNFIWNVYVIYDYSFSLLDYFNYKYSYYTISKKESIKYEITEKYCSSEYINKFKYLQNDFLNMNVKKILKNNSSMIYSPNTIILDGANLFINKNVIKQLDFPLLTELNVPNYINLPIYVYSKNELKLNFDYQLISIYQEEYEISSKFELTNYIDLNILFSDISWNNPNIIEIYYLNYYNNDIILDLSKHLDNIKNNKHNISNNICYITGVPLWDTYIEIQFICTIKKSKKILVCMPVSKFGLQLLYNAPYLYPSQIRDKYFKYNFIDYLKYILNVKNKYKAEYFNIIFKKSNNNIEDVINKLLDENKKKLLLSIEKYGSVYHNTHLYVVNPESNDIFIGIIENDLSDIFLLHMKSKSNIYIFRIIA